MFTVAAFYQFARIGAPATLKPALAKLACGLGVKGSILLAPEGVNGTIAGTPDAIAQVLAHLRALPGCAGLEWKESLAAEMPFRRMKVRLKREIVTMGQPDVDPTAAVGHYIEPADWNALIDAPDVAVIDTRNGYEIGVGTFAGAVDPGTQSFGEFPAWWQANKQRFEGKRIAMFCTGGIRCEKSTNYLIGQGVDDVFHLKGGILKYLEDVPQAETRWQGECYVFDARVSVGHGLVQGNHSLCHACGRPVSESDRESMEFEQGVQCPACVGEYTDSDRDRFRERQKQITLAKAREKG